MSQDRSSGGFASYRADDFAGLSSIRIHPDATVTLKAIDAVHCKDLSVSPYLSRLSGNGASGLDLSDPEPC